MLLKAYEAEHEIYSYSTIRNSLLSHEIRSPDIFQGPRELQTRLTHEDILCVVQVRKRLVVFLYSEVCEWGSQDGFKAAVLIVKAGLEGCFPLHSKHKEPHYWIMVETFREVQLLGSWSYALVQWSSVHLEWSIYPQCSWLFTFVWSIQYHALDFLALVCSQLVLREDMCLLPSMSRQFLVCC